ncbi:DUF4352 domain-containing protein [Candidatus Saccharibacteria bacterium]|nr:DUF4352 domain-containing protein [Candidatus Saccharibacteria bacterium]
MRKVPFETYALVASLVLFVLSLVSLVIAINVATERTHVPYAGIPVGKSISVGSSTLTVDKVTTKTGSQPFVAPEGHEYLVVTLTVRNNGEKPFSVLPTTDTYVKESDGTVDYPAPFTLEKPFHSGIVLPGESTKGELSYLVPKSSAYKLYVEADWTSTAVPFMVKSEKQLSGQ